MTKLEQITKLLEELSGSKRVFSWSAKKKTDVEFFTNPSTDEMKKAHETSGKENCIRFFIEFNKKRVVIWEGGALHAETIRQFDPSLSKKITELFTGTATFSSGKMYIDESDYLDSSNNPVYTKYIIEQFTKHKSWLSKYFSNIKEYVESISKNLVK